MTLDESLVKTIKKDYLDADLTKRERIMLDYVAKLTVSPASVSVEDIVSLRQVGFDDQGILQVNLIASWFNYINRVADGLGVGRRQKGEVIPVSETSEVNL
ncbi:peroxidase [bacterium]|nr:peroxidase [bacterium]